MKLLKDILNKNNFGWICENKKAMKYFKRSAYWKHLKTKIKTSELEEFEECVIDYASKFKQETKYLNLY